MIISRIAQPEDDGRKNHLVCPICKAEDWYYTFWPEKCSGCCKHYPHKGDEIAVNLDRRIEYHRKGI